MICSGFQLKVVFVAHLCIFKFCATITYKFELLTDPSSDRPMIWLDPLSDLTHPSAQRDCSFYWLLLIQKLISKYSLVCCKNWLYLFIFAPDTRSWDRLSESHLMSQLFYFTEWLSRGTWLVGCSLVWHYFSGRPCFKLFCYYGTDHSGRHIVP